mgnify:FL=1
MARPTPKTKLSPEIKGEKRMPIADGNDPTPVLVEIVVSPVEVRIAIRVHIREVGVAVRIHPGRCVPHTIYSTAH